MEDIEIGRIDPDLYRTPGAQTGDLGQPGCHGAPEHVQLNERLGAHGLHDIHSSRRRDGAPRRCLGSPVHVLWPHPDGQRRACVETLAQGPADCELLLQPPGGEGVAGSASERARYQIYLGRTDELGDKSVDWVLVHLFRWANLN
jgi:hypothetical protein